ncbi:MAG: GAF domain-containing protein [Anaerolineae bacterium]|nr:GAF domain-containing protein [Anaerolineae bacterium]MDW8102668.1 GAF domain-containing protein [Anaerolineae bacterium]
MEKEALISAIRRITNAINSAMDLATTLQLITSTTAEVMGMDSCSIYLLDKSGQYLVLRASTGLAPQAIGKARLRLGEGLTGWAALHGVPVAVRDAAADPRFKLLPETEEWHFKSLMAVPLSIQGRIIGAMNVQTSSYHDYTEEEIELLSLVADLAAGAIEKAMLYDNMQRQLEELSALAEVSKTIVSPLYLDDVLKVVVEMAARMIKAEGSLLLLLDEKGELSIRASYGPPKTPPELGEVVSNGKIKVSSGTPSILAVPLIVRERARGVLVCYTEKPRNFSQEEIRFLSTLANQIALAIENATLITGMTVIREMHHRIKNNLQTVAMLLRMQMAEEENKSAHRSFQEAINRILSIAAVHDILSSQGFHQVDILALLEKLGSILAENMRVPGKEITLKVQGQPLFLPARPATALALAVNELLQNALEHAFIGKAQGTISVTVGQIGDRFSVEVVDDGVGFKEPESRQTLGLQIVRTLVEEDLKGSFEINRGNDGRGTRALIEAPILRGIAG